MSSPRPDTPASGSAAPVPASADLAAIVAQAADRADLGATAPALLLELQSGVGSLASLAVEATARGRRPFRPGQGWDGWLGRVAFDLYNLADQTGVDLDAAIRRHARSVAESVPAESAAAGRGWPFDGD